MEHYPSPKAQRNFPYGKHWRVGQQFTVVAKLKHKGKSGKMCPCTMEWSEYANQEYEHEIPGGKKGETEKVPGKHWHQFSDKKWSEDYGDGEGMECVDKDVTFHMDQPGAGFPLENSPWEIWIEVCVYSCEEADCHCDKKKDCARLHQIVKQTEPKTAKADMAINDGGRFRDTVDPPPGSQWPSESR